MRRLLPLFLFLCCAPLNHVTIPNDATAQATECKNVIRFPYVVDNESFETFAADLDVCKGRIAVVEIDSVGGSVAAAFDFQKAIERHPFPVFCVVDGIAASAAFDILMSCDRRFMTERSFLMQHAAATRGNGNQTEMQNTTDALRVIDEGRARRCSRRMGMDLNEYKSHIDGGREWWFSLDDALKYHAVDEEVRRVSDVVRKAVESEITRELAP